MDLLAALLRCCGLSATEQRSRIARLEGAARAGHAEPESRTTPNEITGLDALPDEIQQVIFGQLCNAFDPRAAVDYSSASNGLRELVQRVGEGASKSPLEQLKEENAAAAALCLKAGAKDGFEGTVLRSCKALREAKEIAWYGMATDLSATDLATLSKLAPVLLALEKLTLVDESDSAGPHGWQRLVEGLGVGALPAVTCFQLNRMRMGDAGASALAAALDRGAMPRLEDLSLCSAAIGDAGLVALAPALRRRPALTAIVLEGNPCGDEGLAALVAPPPADAPPPQAAVLPNLELLNFAGFQLTDDGYYHLATSLRSGALPALVYIELVYPGPGNTTSQAGIMAVHQAQAASNPAAAAYLSYLGASYGCPGYPNLEDLGGSHGCPGYPNLEDEDSYSYFEGEEDEEEEEEEEEEEDV